MRPFDSAQGRPVNVQTVDLVMVDFIAMEAIFSFKERGRFVKGPYALIPLAGAIEPAGEVVANPSPDDFLEHLKEFIGHIHRHPEPQQAAPSAQVVPSYRSLPARSMRSPAPKQAAPACSALPM